MKIETVKFNTISKPGLRNFPNMNVNKHCLLDILSIYY